MGGAGPVRWAGPRRGPHATAAFVVPGDEHTLARAAQANKGRPRPVRTVSLFGVRVVFVLRQFGSIVGRGLTVALGVGAVQSRRTAFSVA